MDISGLKSEMLAHPGSYRSGFVVLVHFDDERDAFQKEIIDAIGKENIKCIQFLENFIIVVCLKNPDIRDYVLVNLRNNTFGIQEETKYLVDSVFPIPAYVEILITDILQGLAAAHMVDIRKSFAELFTEITNIELDFIEWDGVTTNAGDLMVRGISRDLEKTIYVIGFEGKRALLGKIEGRVAVKKFRALKNLKEQVGNISVLWGKKTIKDEVRQIQQTSNLFQSPK